MKVVFVSNYINHHQTPFSEVLYHRLGEGYHFIQTEPMEGERLRMGWEVEKKDVPYLVCSYEEEQRCRSLIQDADLALVGWTPRLDLFEKRLGSGKLTLRVSERIYRQGRIRALSPRGLAAKYREHVRYRRDPVYLLCAGAYVAGDFSLIGAYPGKMLRFGYFPPTRQYETGDLFSKKPSGDCLEMVWAGRMIPLKHPEYALRLAGELAGEGRRFVLHMAGGGQMEGPLKEQARQAGLSRQVHFYGFQKPEEVRDLMERCHILLFTSDSQEGWGAVVNEGMNGGCAVVASRLAGAVPFLVEDGKNGLIFDGGYRDFSVKVKSLFDRPERIAPLGGNALRTILETWNAQRAAEACLDFYDGWRAGALRLPLAGPFSRAERI